MPFEKIVAPSQKELFIEQFIKLIFSGEFKVGDKLPTERDIAEMMGINRSAVHNALEELQRMGFVVMEPRRGTFVADYSNDGDFNTLSAIAKYSGENFDQKMRIEMVELRNAVVGGALIRIAKLEQSAAIEKLSELHELHREQARHADDVHSTALRMQEFEMELVRLSGNSIYLLLLNTFGPGNLSIWERCSEFWGASSSLEQEERLISLLEQGEGRKAAQYLEDKHDEFMRLNNIKR